MHEVAAEHVSREIPIAEPAERVEEIRRSLVGRPFECASSVVVCSDRRFLGLISIEALLAAPGDARAEEVMNASSSTVAPGVDQEIAARERSGTASPRSRWSMPRGGSRADPAPAPAAHVHARDPERPRDRPGAGPDRPAAALVALG
jgi:CBS domain-containing protein